MTTTKLTETLINSLPHPEHGQVLYYDSVLPGFGLRITPGCKTFIVQSQVKGVKRRVSIGRCPALNLEAARIKAEALLIEMASGVDPFDKAEHERIAATTLAAALDAFLASRDSMKDTTKFAYRQYIERNLQDWLSLPVKSITADMVEQRHKDLVYPGRWGTEGKTRADHTFQIMRVLLKWAAHNYQVDGKPLLSSNPVDRLTVNKRWHQPVVRQGVIPDAELPRFFKLLMQQPKLGRDFILLLLLTALRKNEAAQLKWTDVDFDKRTLTIPSGFNKSKRDHVLPMTSMMEAILRSRQGNGSEYVFEGRYTGHLNDPRAVLAHMREAMGWNWLLHDLRRSCLSIGEKIDVPFLALQKIANHSLERNVTDRYLVLDVEFIRPHMTAINERLLALMQTSVQGWRELDQVAVEPRGIAVERIGSVMIVEEEAEEEEVYF